MLKSRLKFKTMNIFIIGPMGSGKSTVGKILSDELFLNFFDTDEDDYYEDEDKADDNTIIDLTQDFE